MTEAKEKATATVDEGDRDKSGSLRETEQLGLQKLKKKLNFRCDDSSFRVATNRRELFLYIKNFAKR